MTKYRIVKLFPDGYQRAYAIQTLEEGKSWVDLFHSIYNSRYDDFESAESNVHKIIELDKWNATHGKYQVLKEYE